MPARQSLILIKTFLLFLIASAIFLASATRIFAVNFIQNSDFESSSIDPWVTSGGGAAATLSAELVHSGTNALKIQHSKTASYGFQQTIKDVEGGMFYKVSGYGVTNDSNTASYFLRVAWYESSDGSGSQLSSPTDTNKGERTDGNWVWFESVVQAPTTAHSVKVRLVLNSKTDGVIAWANFDDVDFQESVAPPPTPTEELEDNSAPTPTPTPKPPTPTPTKKPTPTPTSTPIPLPTGEILGEEATPSGQELTPSPEILGETTSNLSDILPKALIGVGILFLLTSGGFLLLPKIRMYNRKDGESQTLE